MTPARTYPHGTPSHFALHEDLRRAANGVAHGWPGSLEAYQGARSVHRLAQHKQKPEDSGHWPADFRPLEEILRRPW